VTAASPGKTVRYITCRDHAVTNFRSERLHQVPLTNAPPGRLPCTTRFMNKRTGELGCAVSSVPRSFAQQLSSENFHLTKDISRLADWFLFPKKEPPLLRSFHSHSYEGPIEVATLRPGRPRYLQGCLAPEGIARRIRYVVIPPLRVPLKSLPTVLGGIDSMSLAQQALGSWMGFYFYYQGHHCLSPCCRATG
jgi:hypothetical protein